MEKKPFLTEAMAQEIIQDVPTPFHVYDEKGIRENARRINKAFSWNKGFKEYFAVKALPNPVILQILKEEGCGVDCSSLTELMLSEVCGFSGSEIMFSSNQTPVEDMKKAYELGAYINLDDATMVEFLERVAGVPENIFCRYNPGGTFSLGESEEGFQVMDKPGDAKYGMTEEQMIESYKKLAAKGAKNFGIHAFLASNTISDEYYPELPPRTSLQPSRVCPPRPCSCCPTTRTSSWLLSRPRSWPTVRWSFCPPAPCPWALPPC